MPKQANASYSITPQSAIAQALRQNWKGATIINSELVKMDKDDIDAINRLGFAFMKLGQITHAKRIFEQALKIDPYNQIALKNNKRLTTLKRKDVSAPVGQNLSPLLFLEEPGKTKIVALVNPPPAHMLLTLTSGQEVTLKPRNHCVEIRTGKNAYLGALPDDLSFKLLKFLNGGNRYQVHVKSIGKNFLTVIIRELERGSQFANSPSFTASQPPLSPSRPNRDGEGPDVTPTGEDEIEPASPDLQGTNRDS
ncbi:hypothetical protein A2875_00975 [Candidatus Gottesmanbacteria bacterium RIFCSPHIGHO2_01_FULL_46_14]|uniref:Uncharacterized protein n=2 Tax=Candidatus Gottesmaniibacteriota TaxID=1752720 RepID=A0A1F5ZNB1_9BACT|nr:MAG: hypothetical protein A2875_00975 [Candidatus Gottesmanbacteria bacterium RIFCSPHIGHO2_01_FULL_46_14]OGG29584.1 MAG: hypothetical protein A2971_00905 [Candidatus Gottesmanbacteria bacterium RIFCSPLOWO2_01_FULL_46_21]